MQFHVWDPYNWRFYQEDDTAILSKVILIVSISIKYFSKKNTTQAILKPYSIRLRYLQKVLNENNKALCWTYERTCTVYLILAWFEYEALLATQQVVLKTVHEKIYANIHKQSQ